MEIQTDKYEVDTSHACPVCGEKMFEWGIVSRFTPVTYRRGFALFRFDSHMGVKARHCLTCDHLQLFADEELAKEQQRGAQIFALVALIIVVIVTSFVVGYLT